MIRELVSVSRMTLFHTSISTVHGSCGGWCQDFPGKGPPDSTNKYSVLSPSGLIRGIPSNHSLSCSISFLFSSSPCLASVSPHVFGNSSVIFIPVYLPSCLSPFSLSQLLVFRPLSNSPPSLYCNDKGRGGGRKSQAVLPSLHPCWHQCFLPLLLPAEHIVFNGQAICCLFDRFFKHL